MTDVGRRLSTHGFDALFDLCSNWGRWGDDDTRGTLNHIGPEQVVEASRTIRLGLVVSCARPLDTHAAIDNPDRLLHHMTRLPATTIEGAHGVGVASDFLGLECHGEVHSHVDALCHIAYRGRLYNGWPAETVTENGAPVSGLDATQPGIVSRGVLLDVATMRGGRWLDGGVTVSVDDLEAAERSAGVRVRPGDVVLLRTGHALRRKTTGPWDSANEKAGLDPRAMPWLRTRQVAAIGFDGDGDASPHHCEVPVPIHVLGINAMGLHFFDALDLDELAETCAREGRWAFFFAALPIRAERATGCAINPVAVF